MEVLFITLIFFIVFGIFLGIISSATEKTDTASLGEARMQGEKVAEAINSVYIHGSGYQINITIPSTPNMTMHVNSSLYYITVVHGTQSIAIKVIAPSVKTMDIVSGTNDTIYTIYNLNGTVYIKKN